MSVSRTAFASPPDRIPLFEEAVRIEPSTVQYVRTHVSPVCMPSQNSYSSSLPLLATCNLHTQVLTTRNLGPEAAVDVVMTPCGDYTYFCCGQDDAARTCCTEGNGTVLLAAGTAILPTATVTYTDTITGTGSLTTCLSTGTAATAGLNGCQSTNHTVPIAAGLGAALGVAAITAVAFAVMWKQKSNRLIVLEHEAETSRYTGR